MPVIPLKAIHDSQAIRGLGFDEEKRMLVVQFAGSDSRYGYPNLSDEELSGLVDVLEHHESLGHYIATVIKPNHDHERVQF
ncbi:KTSC domain-containing protein [Ramlibacter humi]|uniref:KTSC domain-containing protein n=1 Tax=Ramlibacter humi TaxID=2530451 RepID=A0A4Z0C8W8_9BURK|nr:KTSC domain-containing protein [Ramlibacter humi]TFZ08127.1 KTSC domain-containing protein [Ramlibacter humi]